MFGLVAASTHAAPKKAAEPVATVTYDIAEFLQSARPDDQPNPKIAPIDPDAPIGSDSEVTSQTEVRQQFIKLICQTIDPRSWQPDYMPATSISIDGQRMIVSQTKENHRAIANLLQQLHGTGAEKVQAAFNQFRLANCKFEKTELFLAVQSIAKETKIPIEVDWRSFANVVVFVDSPTTVDLKTPTAPRAIRALFNAAAGYTFPISINATPKAITVSYDHSNPKLISSRIFDVRSLPARVSGLDPAKPFTRAEALGALVDRIKKEIPDIKEVREAGGGLIVTAPPPIQLRVIEFLDDLDAQAIVQAAPASKRAGKEGP